MHAIAAVVFADFPAGHCLHDSAAADSVYWPAAQSPHTFGVYLKCAAMFEYLPGTQLSHELEPAIFEYFPAGQSVQTPVGAFVNWDAGHAATAVTSTKRTHSICSTKKASVT